MAMKFHEVADIFPMMDSFEFVRFAADIKEKGLKQAIVVHDGKIVDGRNRFKACEMARIEPTFVEWDQQGSLVDFVLSCNLHRRHLTESQRAMVAARIANLSKGDNQHAGIQACSQPAAAKSLRVSRDSVQRARKVQSAASPVVTEAVDRGEMSLNDAIGIIDLPEEQQEQVVETVRSGGAKTARRAAEKFRSQPVNRTVPARKPLRDEVQEYHALGLKLMKKIKSADINPKGKKLAVERMHTILRRLRTVEDTL